MKVQNNRAALLIEAFKAVSTDFAIRDKRFSLNHFKQPIAKWSIELSMADALLDAVFPNNPQEAADLKPIIRREFSVIKHQPT